jgi:GDP-4-dehydro-6-deoxy-D-mannose reductase
LDRWLITGAEGYIGSVLAAYLAGKGVKISGLVFGEDLSRLERLGTTIRVFPCDVRNRAAVESVLQSVRPNVVVHLAAQSFVTVSWAAPEETLRTNITGTLNLLEAIRSVSREGARVILVSSSAVYGPRDQNELPIKERSEFRPTSIYAVSKVAQDMLGYYFWQSCAMDIMRVRPFSITGPGKRNDACADFAKAVAEAEAGISDKVGVGNMESVRDITDGRDAVRAIWLLAEKGSSGEVYNLCSGVARRMADVLSYLLSLSMKPLTWGVVREKTRPFDDPVFVGDNSRLRALGWQPEIPLNKTLLDMLNYWRARTHEGRVGTSGYPTKSEV